jgi:hypothetical protein
MNSFIHATIDWIILGYYTGFQESEWCSGYPCTFVTIDNPNWDNQPKALPLIADDFSYALVTG